MVRFIVITERAQRETESQRSSVSQGLYVGIFMLSTYSIVCVENFITPIRKKLKGSSAREASIDAQTY